MILGTNNVESIKIRPIILDDYKFVLNWSKDDDFCFSYLWEQNRSEE